MGEGMRREAHARRGKTESLLLTKEQEQRKKRIVYRTENGIVLWTSDCTRRQQQQETNMIRWVGVHAAVHLIADRANVGENGGH